MEGVEPFYNGAARMLRLGVVWCKESLGTQPAEVSRLVEALMAVVATLKPRHRNALDYVAVAYTAALHDETALSSIPILDSIDKLVRPAM
jgi:hypothetical protein